MAQADGSGRHYWGWASTVVAAAATGVYVVQNTLMPSLPTEVTFPWAILMLVGTNAALISAMTRDRRVGWTSAIVAAVVLGVLGVVGIFSGALGLGFILAAALAGIAAADRRPIGRHMA